MPYNWTSQATQAIPFCRHVSETGCFQLSIVINRTVVNNPEGKSLFTFMYVLLEKFARIAIDRATGIFKAFDMYYQIASRMQHWPIHLPGVYETGLLPKHSGVCLNNVSKACD